MAQILDVNITPQSYLPEIRVSENDNTIRTFRVNIIDDDGEAYQIPSGVTATFAGTKPSGLGFTIPCTIDGSAVLLTIENTACNEQGRFPAEIRLINGDARIGTCNVLLNVEPNPHPDDTTDGDREPLINEITALLEEIREVSSEALEEIAVDVDRAEDAADRAEQAAVNAGYMFFYIDNDPTSETYGHLIYQRTSNTQVDFYLQNGNLFVEAAA